MRYTVTITEYHDGGHGGDGGYLYDDGDVYDTEAAAKIVRSAPHTGEAFEILQAAVEQRNNPAEPVIHIYRGAGPDGATVGLAELVEAARVGATTSQDREIWVDAMVTLIEGWVYPWDGTYPMDPPPDVYWEQAGRWWADLVTVPPPEDLIAALREHREDLGGCNFGGYQSFVDVARRLTATTSAVRRASAAFEAPAPGAAPGTQPRELAPSLTSLPHDVAPRYQGLGR